jgi:uncharacterized protein
LKHIGILSDTHGSLDDRIFFHFEKCDEVWHAGDIGSMEVIEKLEKSMPLRAVFGNIDGYEIRKAVPEIQRFFCEEVDVLIKHIGGYPGRYDRSIFPVIQENPPKLFVAGHSHILKVMPDRKYDLLHINPGAAGHSGIHKVRTLIRLIIDGSTIRDLEVIELEKR